MTIGNDYLTRPFVEQEALLRLSHTNLLSEVAPSLYDKIDYNKVIEVTSSNNTILYVAGARGLFHIIQDHLPTIKLLSERPDVDENTKLVFIFVTTSDKNLDKLVHMFSNIFFNFVDVLIIDPGTVLKVNNFLNITTPRSNFEEKKYVVDMFLDDLAVKYRKDSLNKVYLSRRHIPPRQIETSLDLPDGRINDTRIKNEIVFEKYLEALGFLIVAPEEISTIEEQISILSSCKLLVSATSSGLANQVFMPRGSLVVELTVPFIVDNHDVKQDLHLNYLALSYMSEHQYLSIPNKTTDAYDVINTIENNKYLKQIFLQ